MMVNLYGQKNLIPALKSGLVDGFVGMQPVVAEAEFSGAGKNIAYLDDYESPEGKGYFPCCAIAAREDFIKSDPEAAEKFLLLMMRANRYISENPLKAAPDVARWLDEPVEIEKLSLPTIKYCAELCEEWKKGSEAWFKVAVGKNEIGGEVRKAYEKGDAWERIFDLPLFRKASKKL
jgi:NitT/TauT family transport system substrate-binding protein